MKQTFSKQETGFTQIKNSVLLDKKLSLKAKGLYAYLFSKPDEWHFATLRIADELGIGKDQVLTGLRELEEVGYLSRKKNADGRVEYYISYDINPKSQNPTQATEPKSDIAKVGLSHSGIIRPISNIDIESNTDKDNNTDNTSTEQSSDAGGKDEKEKISMEQVREVIDAFAVVNESYREFYGKKTQYYAAKTLIKTYPKEQIMWMIKTAPGYNKMPYRSVGDKVYTPYDLLKKWSIMKDNLVSYKIKKVGETKEIVR